MNEPTTKGNEMQEIEKAINEAREVYRWAMFGLLSFGVLSSVLLAVA